MLVFVVVDCHFFITRLNPMLHKVSDLLMILEEEGVDHPPRMYFRILEELEWGVLYSLRNPIIL
jgi:hypothetical protein